MKNKNQKKLKNKKYRWGAYGRTTVGGRGCTPFIFSTLQRFSLSILKFFPKRYKWLPFFAVLLQPKTKDKVFWQPKTKQKYKPLKLQRKISCTRKHNAKSQLKTQKTFCRTLLIPHTHGTSTHRGS